MDTTELLELLREDIKDVSLCYDVWREFVDSANKESFEPVLEDNPAFFYTVIHSSLVALIIYLYRLYEPKRKTVNLRQLVARAKKTGNVSGENEKLLDEKTKEVEKTWVKVCIIRNNAFGHSSNNLHTSLAFEKAGITPNEIGILIENMKSIWNIVSRALYNKSYAYNTSATQAVHELVESLK